MAHSFPRLVPLRPSFPHCPTPGLTAVIRTDAGGGRGPVQEGRTITMSSVFPEGGAFKVTVAQAVDPGAAQSLVNDDAVMVRDQAFRFEPSPLPSIIPGRSATGAPLAR